MSIITKICSKCGEDKKTSEFYKQKSRKDGLYPYCKKCSSEESKKYVSNNPEKVKLKHKQWLLKNSERAKQATKVWHSKNSVKIKEQDKQRHLDNPNYYKQKSKQYNSNPINKEKHRQYYLKNKDKIKQQTSLWQKNNTDKFKKCKKEWYLNNTEKFKKYQKEWCFKNKDKISLQRNKRISYRRKTDAYFRGLCICRAIVRRGLNGNPKLKHSMEYIMCSVLDFRLHIESQWEAWMNWKNYGSGLGTWQIDHIIPCSFFKGYITDEVEKYMCCRYQNLRPLSWEENQAKKDKIIVNEIKNYG